VQVGARVELDDFEALRRDTTATLLDVRNPGEVEQGSIPGSLRIPLAELSQRHGGYNAWAAQHAMNVR
jgi:rhodanese-related sulfurtransferase